MIKEESIIGKTVLECPICDNYRRLTFVRGKLLNENLLRARNAYRESHKLQRLKYVKSKIFRR